MLELVIPERELYDEINEEFVNVKRTVLHLEHSLISVSKWETKWKKPFLKPNYKFTREEFLDYIRCMTIDQNVPKSVYYAITGEEINKVSEYVDDSKTATRFNRMNNTSPNTQVVTSELIYYWMVAYQIPFECQKWHLSRLLTLIEICNIKNSKGTPMSKKSILEQNRMLNAARRKATGSRG